MNRTDTEKSSRLLLWSAGAMIILVPFVRLIEAGLRLVFMKGHYGNYWEGLRKDVWFSEGWLAYIKTPFGLTMTFLPLVLIVGAITCFLCAVNGSSTRKTKQAEQDGALNSSPRL